MIFLVDLVMTLALANGARCPISSGNDAHVVVQAKGRIQPGSRAKFP